MVEGKPHKVVATAHAANTAVFRRRTSARSRPSPHRTDESEEVDGDMVREAPPLDERLDGTFDALELAGHYGPTGPHVMRLVEA